ncbi:hypothetical protein SAMN05216452_0941 [Nitratireductor aquibiodomus]|uniref:Uncharacterized protein n=1 Tax=Nitratireductor aquibiodomus TaxID=204799 RepID=A0A1H4J327_9HYPH|nr:hypothetical protein SAMN05216452_0941 [Nitratireductor aquibiodomus]
MGIGSADRPALNEAEIEVTPEMVQVGVTLLIEYEEGEEYDRRRFVSHLFRAVEAERPNRCPSENLR